MSAVTERDGRAAPWLADGPSSSGASGRSHGFRAHGSELATPVRTLRPATAALYAKLLRLTILTTWANRPVGDITAAEISAWYAGMRTTPTQQANAY